MNNLALLKSHTSIRLSEITEDLIATFQELIYEHYRIVNRSFPWRQTRDPYAILVSEIMLQQTQTYRVLPKYEAWMSLFPTVKDLANASLHDVLSAWQGLGYNRRGLALHKCAKLIVSEFGGVIPSEPEQLILLPGVGPYTSRAVSTFAFGVPNIFIETNIRTVFIHFFFTDCEGVKDEGLIPFIEKTLDYSEPRSWYYALMDYGVMLKSEVINPSRRSAHHSKQSKFEGSDRQIRGAIVRLLTKQGAVTKSEVLEKVSSDTKRVQKILDKLVCDGLICSFNDCFRIAE